VRRLCLLLIAGLLTASAAAAADTPTTIPVGVTIAGVQVGGLAPDVATATVEQGFELPLQLKVGTTTVLVTPNVLGATPVIDKAIERALTAEPNSAIPLGVTVEPGAVAHFVGTLAQRFDRPAADAKVYLRNLRPWLSTERPGRKLVQRTAVHDINVALTDATRQPVVLVTTAVKPKVTRRNFGPVIVIRRSSNQLMLYDGVKYVRFFAVATGQSIYPTPLGRFAIAVMWRNPWWYPPNSPWAAGSKPIPPGPGNPLGTRWMGLTAPGVGIHGTPDPASIGYSASHGCIRMYIPQAEWLFDHVAIGTPVFIVSA